MELKCKCTQCAQPIEFPSEMAGQTVACPHCKFDTVLAGPASPPEPVGAKTPKPRRKKLIEDRLEFVGSVFFVLFTVAWILALLAAALNYTGSIARLESTDLSFTLIIAAIGFYIQGYLVRLAFHAVAEIIRLLRLGNLQRQELILKWNP